MQKKLFIYFLTIVLSIYLFINIYIALRGFSAISNAGPFRSMLLILFIFLVLAYPVGRLLQNFFRNSIVEFLLIAGSFYMGIMVYLFLFTLTIDIIRFINSIFPFFPAGITNNPQKATQVTALIVLGSVVFITIVGHINALLPRVRHLSIHIGKPAANMKEMTIVVASDIHLGTIIRNSRLQYLVDKINSLKPDLILFPGDMVDEDVSTVMEQNMAARLRKLKAPLGIYAATGNHEYFGGVKEAVNYIGQGGVTVLQDRAVKIAGAFYLIGRKDLIANRFEGGRKPLAEILKDIDKNLPLILMDHQPFHLEEAQQNSIDLQISGHTHNGQLFPFNLLTKRIYEKSWGFLRKGNTQYYVSCGVGTWGPPIRLGSRPEIVKIQLHFH